MARARMKLRVAKKSKRRPQREETDDDLGIRSVQDIKRPRSWAIYGRSGSGKTTLCATFPKPVLFLDIRDQGTDSVSDEEEVFAKDIESFEDLEDIYYYLKRHPKKYKTLVVDTVTQLQQLLTEEVKPKASKTGTDWGSLSRREFGDVAAKMKEWIFNLRSLPMEVIFLAQERTSRDDEDNPDQMIVPEVGPHVMPSIAIVLNASVSIIGNTFVRSKKTKKILRSGKRLDKEDALYCLRVGPSPVYTTKLRKPKSIEAPAYIENPTYDDVVAIIRGEL